MSELEDFLARLESEISMDSVSADTELQKQKSENKRLQSYLVTMNQSSKEILNLYKLERQTTMSLQAKLDETLQELNNLQRKFDDVERTNVNQTFNLTELMNEMKLKQEEERKDYIELCLDYLDLFSEITCFFNYEVKKPQNKIISKTEKFLYQSLGKFKKPKILRSKARRDEDERSTASSRVSSRVSKRSANKTKNVADVKRRKTEIWDMKSISQASSPAATIPFEDEEASDLSSDIFGTESSFSFNTFSIGNETNFSFLQKNSPDRQKKCRCHLNESELVLVSVGVNTEPPEEERLSLPNLLETDNDLEVPPDCLREEQLEEITEEPETLIERILEVKSAPKFTNASSNTESENTEIITTSQKETSDRGTSTESKQTSNKSTATVHSTTTRGTSTPIVVMKHFGVQFPEISMERIFTETIFELPDIISPIHEFEDAPAKSTTETITELCNVNREIDYSGNPVWMKVENPHQNSEEQSFIILGQTLFKLFMKRIKKSNESLTDDEITRRKIWKHLKRQLLDRFSELKFDETLNGSFSDVDLSEKVVVPDDFNNNNRDEEVEEEKFDDFHDDLIVSDSEDEEFEEIEQEAEEETSEMHQEESEEKFETHQNESEETFEALERESELTFEALQVDSKISEDQPSLVQTSQIQELELETFVDDFETSNEVLVTLENQENQVEEPQKELEALETNLQNSEAQSEPFDSHEDEFPDLSNFDEIFQTLQSICLSPPQLIEPIDELEDIIWTSLFPEKVQDEATDRPASPKDVLDGFDLDHEPVEIPTENDEEIQNILNGKSRKFTVFETPKSPPPFAIGSESFESIEIPTNLNSRPKMKNFESILDYIPEIRLSLVKWQQRGTITTKCAEKKLCKTRKIIKTYLDEEWTDESLEKCLEAVDPFNEGLMMKAIYETVEDNKWQKEINTEFTPPAPPLPRYQQKLVLLIKRLAELNPKLPHRLIEDFEEKLFKLENHSKPLDDLRNLSYYYSALVDLFFEGNTTMVFYFIVKCFYFFGCKAIPMVFVVVKAFPLALPKKSLLLKKHSTSIDWENMTGLELSRIRVDLEWMDSLDLTVMYLLTSIQTYRKNSPVNKTVKDHELFNYVPKFYGFPLSFIAAPKLLDFLVGRVESGELENLSMSLILLGRRANLEFTVRTMLKGKLNPLLNKYVEEVAKKSEISQLEVDRICLLIEVISTVLKPLSDEKEKSFKEIFPMIVGILGRMNQQKVLESCIQAILRLQRFIDNHKEIFTIIQHHQERFGASMSDGLRYAIQTFVHRKNENTFKSST